MTVRIIMPEGRQPDPKEIIRTLNDRLRRTFQGGQVMITAGMRALEPKLLAELLSLIRAYDRFDQDNDPHHEHDFGSVNHRETKVYWKIDYFDVALTYGSEDPADPAVTIRVLTIMRDYEW